MAIQIGTVDGLINITEEKIRCLVNAINEFSKGGVQFARKNNVSLGAAFQRFVEPVYTKTQSSFVLKDILNPVYTKGGKEQSPARITFCRKMGLLNIDDQNDIFELTPLAKELNDDRINIEEYAFILLTKQGVFKNGIFCKNLFAAIAEWFENNSIISEAELRDNMCNLLSDNFIEKTRADIIINALAMCGLTTSIGQGAYVISNLGFADIFSNFRNNQSKLSDSLRDDDAGYTEFIGTLKYGIFDILSPDNIEIFTRKYPNLTRYMQTDKNTVTQHQPLGAPLQQIFYGAPGTGKSHGISCLTSEVKSENIIRTTFHPDSDYSTFVGAYKPTMREVPVVTLVGTQQVQVKDVQGKPVTERRIEYNFVPQAFTQAYIKAWKNLNEPVYLVIEEINRGNCAQIFGDIFQLLDRKDNGYSDYWITPDEELTKFLRSKFETEGIDSAAFDVIRSGEKMCLPKNLHIWATMNTSDQSLFPIDSAFKRRWDWKYVPIDTEKEDWTISVNGAQYSWSDFLQKINFEIGDVTSSEDKKLGFYFCKAQDGEISSERFVSKVLFYIYNDVFKDYDFSRDFFKHKEGERKGKTIGFQEYFHTDGSINQDVVEELLNNLGVDSMLDYENEEGGNATGQSKRNKFVIDGQPPKNMANTGEYIITKYLNENPGLSYAELRDRLPDSLAAGSGLPAVIKMQTDDLKSYERYYKNVDYITSDGVAIKILKQWNSPHFKNIVEFAKQLNWIVTELPSE